MSDRNLELSFVENAVLDWGEKASTINGETRAIRTILDRRVDIFKKRRGWVTDLWTHRYVSLRFIWISATGGGREDVRIDAQLTTRSVSVLCSDALRIYNLIQELRTTPDIHIHLIGLESRMRKIMMLVLYPSLSYISSFTSPYIAHVRLLNALACDPQQRYMRRFPVYYPGFKWDVQAATFRCGLSPS